MARIPNDEIERLKRDISLERLVTARGIELRRHGQDLVGCCPFHDDRTPSLVITPEKNLWHCLGACQAGGSVIDWVMKVEGVSFRHAVEMLRGDASFGAPRVPRTGRQVGPVPKKGTARKLPTVLERSANDDTLMLQVVDYYHRCLKESPEALEYLAKRGLRDSEMIERHRLGYANRTLGYRLGYSGRIEGGHIRGRLQELGIFRESGHEHLNGSVVIPVFDESGRVTEMYGRKITPNLRDSTTLHLYLPGPHRGVWNVSALEASEEIILCESLIDALTFWCAGYRNVTASYGVEGFTDDHRAAFRKYGTKCVRIAYDRDEAGERAAEKLSTELAAMGIETYRVQFPKGMDANEYAQKVQPANKSLGMVLRHALWMAKGQGPAPMSADNAPSPEAPEDIGKESVEVSMSCESLHEAEDHPFLAAEIAAPDDVGGDAKAPPSAPASPPSMLSSTSADERVFPFGDRRWRVRGLDKNLSHEQLRVNVLVSREGAGFFVDTLEMYSARQRAAFTKQAADELGLDERIVRHDFGEVLLQLEATQDAKVQEALKPKAIATAMSEAEHEAAMSLLKDPRLCERILGDYDRCGVVGEETNKLVGYLAAVSRKLEEPLAIVIQSSSAAGKSSLMEAVLQFVPEEERVQYSAMTGQSLFYMGEADLKHKILAVAEEEGAERASYALKLLQSEGELTIASTGKDPATGKLVTHAYRVEGPVMIFLTTTAIDVDEELLNRCLVLTVDEGQAQTRAIHERQRESQTLEGMLARRERARIRAMHKNAQRLLRPLLVVNPYARELEFADTRTRTRRDHMKYLTLIRTIALLHQHQRPVRVVEHGGERVEYVEVTRDDIALAERLCAVVLRRDEGELPPQTAKLFELVRAMVSSRAEAIGTPISMVRFSRREVREHTSWGNTQLKVHLRRLEELEYLLVHRADRGQSFVYELCDADRSGGGRPLVGGMSAGGRDGKPTTNVHKIHGLSEVVGPSADRASPAVVLNGASYAQAAGE